MRLPRGAVHGGGVEEIRARMVAEDGGEAGVTTRVDTGVREGDAVSMHYDPMVAKVGKGGPSFWDLMSSSPDV